MPRDDTVEPQPGEVWVVTDPWYGPESWDRIYDPGPFIVTYLGRDRIGFVAAGDAYEPVENFYRRHQWDWGKHATRLWPPVPSWDELAQKPAPDDLRTQYLREA